MLNLPLVRLAAGFVGSSFPLVIVEASFLGLNFPFVQVDAVCRVFSLLLVCIPEYRTCILECIEDDRQDLGTHGTGQQERWGRRGRTGVRERGGDSECVCERERE